MRDLGDLGYPYSWAYGLNASGEVVGLSATSTSGGHAFLYSGGVMRDLGTFGGSSSQANAIDDAGEVVGQSRLASNGPTYPYIDHAFLYSDGTMHDLGTLQPGGTSQAYGINASGQITGTASDPSMSLSHAFLYANGVMTDIGAAISGGTYGRGINASGQIVGSGSTPDDSYATLYTRATGLVDLNSLLPPNSGWVLTDAFAINDAGQIVGWGRYLGQYNGFLLQISTITADVNGDGRVDCTDVSVVKAGIGKKTGQPGFDPSADVNHDGVIDVRDLAIVTQSLPTGAVCH